MMFELARTTDTMTTSHPTKLVTFLTLTMASLSSGDAFTFSPVTRFQQPQSCNAVRMYASINDGEDGWQRMTGGAAAFVAGLGIMAQVAFADNAVVGTVDSPAFTQIHSSSGSSNVILSVGAPSFGGGASFETLDFSLPSYNEAVGKSVSSKPAPKKEASDFLGGMTGSSSQSDEDVSAAKADKEKAESDARAAKEADARAAKEEAKRAAAEKKEAEQAEKAAAEVKKQEEAEAKASKEAEKEARKAAEKEKQRLAVERQKAAKEEEKETAAPSVIVPDVKIPDISSIKMELPKMVIPKIDVSKFDIPKPESSAPEFKAPDFPSVSIPKVSVPSVDFKAPTLPDVKLPSFSMPKFEIPPTPSFDVPKFDVPAAPSFNVPTKSTASSSSYVDLDSNVEPQEVRDARAAAKNVEFKEADGVAKDAEKAASLARNIANDAKKAFKSAKGEACATRPGGKLLCLRGFGVGY